MLIPSPSILFMVQRASAVAVIGLVATSAARADDTAIFDKLMSQRGPAIVTLKFVLKVKSSAGEEERESEINGAMVDPKGLVICESVQTGGFSEAMKRRLSRGDFSVTPTDMKVLVGDDTEGVEAAIVARDTDLDLAWVQIKKPPEKPYVFIDLAKGVTGRPGEDVFVVRRLDKYFDRAAAISEGWIAGVVKKPRELYVPGGTISTAQGLPAFTSAGEVLGMVIMQVSDEDDPRGARNAAGAFILPAAEVVRATQRARESAASGKSGAGDEDDGEKDETKESKDEKPTDKADKSDKPAKKNDD